MKNILRFCCLLLAMAMLFAGCGKPTDDDADVASKENMVTDTAFKMDTVVTISIYDWEEETTIEAAFAEIDRLEQLLSVDKPGSDLAKLYQNAGIAPVQMSEETVAVLKAANKYAKLSEGYFDVTSGPLISLWNIKDGQGDYPTDSQRQAAMELIDYQKLEISDDNMVFLTEPGMKANLGAIAKGYIADKVKEFLLAKGVEHAVINLGGNVLTIGEKPSGEGFAIGIQDPLGATGNIILALTSRNDSLVSSGTYERFFEYNGKRYHHILDPFTGFPADNQLVGVTILSESSTEGDALSTICILYGLEKAMSLIESLPGVEAAFVTADGKVTMTQGLKERVLE